MLSSWAWLWAFYVPSAGLAAGVVINKIGVVFNRLQARKLQLPSQLVVSAACYNNNFDYTVGKS